MNKQYSMYLKSSAWQAKKRACIERSKQNANSDNMFGVCERCGYRPWKPILQLHHKKYDHIFNEPLEDLELLCPRCHREETKKQKEKVQ